jgi:membrane protease YdiL (CAAX protease family)
MKSASKKHTNTWFSLITFISMVCVGIILGQLALKILFATSGITSQGFIAVKTKYKDILLFSQAIMATAIFIVGPLLYWYVCEKKSIHYFFSGEQKYGRFIILTLGLTFAAMMVNTFFIDWNMHVKFPAWLKGFEEWSQQKEEQLRELTKLLTTFKSLRDLLKTIVVIAIIPAIGEEFVFRGILQNLFFRSTKNIHISILISAFIFSAIHLQIYGFVPRVLLGVLFGYIYWWTQNLTFPIIAHFFNNSFALVTLFLYHKKGIGYDLDNGQTLPLPAILLFASIVMYLAIYFEKNTRYIHK